MNVKFYLLLSIFITSLLVESKVLFYDAKVENDCDNFCHRVNILFVFLIYLIWMSIYLEKSKNRCIFDLLLVTDIQDNKCIIY